ncbi:hypothetical protein FB451DRAFT_1370216 [Mycena latifolia]|nr:hypothetical protein FB451DRAFT_1370216 [Mycena latifolia]
MVKIRVTNHSDNVWAEYDVDLAGTVRKLKAAIENTEGTAIGRQCLKYEGQELRDKKDLQSYSIQEGSIVEYFPSQNVHKFADIAMLRGGSGQGRTSREGVGPEVFIRGGTGGAGGQSRHQGGKGGVGGEGGDSEGSRSSLTNRIGSLISGGTGGKGGTGGAGGQGRHQGGKGGVGGEGGDSEGSLSSLINRIGSLISGGKGGTGGTGGAGGQGGHQGLDLALVRQPEALTAREAGGRDGVQEAGGGGGGGGEARGKAIYEWDGNMKHPNVKGLPLRIGMIVSQVAIDRDPDPEWPRGYAEDRPDVIGYFPPKYIGSLEPNSAQDGAGNLNDKSPGQIPDLPPFHFPKASRSYFKSCAFGERSHSYLQVTLDYETLARPGDSTPVNVTLDCIAAGERRITSVSLMITSPGQTVKDVGCAQSPGGQQSIHVEATREIENERHRDGSLAVPNIPLEITAGGSHQQEETVVEPGTRELKIQCFKKDGSTAHWVVKGAEGVDGRRGDVPATMKLSFILEEKPAIFQYGYSMTTVVKTGAKEREESHSGGSADDGEFN